MRRGQDGMRCRGGGKVFMAGGGVRAGLTGQRQRRLVPPGFLLKTRPPFPPRAPRSRVSSPSSATTLFFTSLSPPFVPSLLHPPVPPACSLFLAPFLHFSHFLSFLPPLPALLVWAITDTQQRAERWGWAAAAVGCGDWGGGGAKPPGAARPAGGGGC